MTKHKIVDHEAEAVGPDDLPQTKSPPIAPSGAEIAAGLRALADRADAGEITSVAGLAIRADGVSETFVAVDPESLTHAIITAEGLVGDLREEARGEDLATPTGSALRALVQGQVGELLRSLTAHNAEGRIECVALVFRDSTGHAFPAVVGIDAGAHLPDLVDLLRAYVVDGQNYVEQKKSPLQ